MAPLGSAWRFANQQPWGPRLEMKSTAWGQVQKPSKMLAVKICDDAIYIYRYRYLWMNIFPEHQLLWCWWIAGRVLIHTDWRFVGQVILEVLALSGALAVQFALRGIILCGRRCCQVPNIFSGLPRNNTFSHRSDALFLDSAWLLQKLRRFRSWCQGHPEVIQRWQAKPSLIPSPPNACGRLTQHISNIESLNKLCFFVYVCCWLVPESYSQFSCWLMCLCKTGGPQFQWFIITYTVKIGWFPLFPWQIQTSHCCFSVPLYLNFNYNQIYPNITGSTTFFGWSNFHLKFGLRKSHHFGVVRSIDPMVSPQTHCPDRLGYQRCRLFNR
jgi:hypothetical protein